MTRIKKRRDRLYRQQQGRCHWCGTPMLNRPRAAKDSPLPYDCTLDHLDDRFSPHRGASGGREERTVAACWSCNQQRCNESLRQNIDEQRRRTQAR